MIRFATALTASLLASGVAAQSIYGTFDMSAEACASDMSDGRFELTPTAVYHWEGSCQLTNPTNLRDMPKAKLFDAKCSGEGSEWTYRVMYAPSYDGNTLLRYTADGFWTYVRCQ